jgi:hypothetical protein
MEKKILLLTTTFEKKRLALNTTLINEIKNLRNETTKAIKTTYDFQANLNELNIMREQNINPIESVLNGWLDDLNRAMSAYIQAVTQSLVNTIDYNDKTNIITPLKNWFECYHQSILGLPSSISGCEGLISHTKTMMQSLKKIYKSIHKFSSLGITIPRLEKLEALPQLIKKKLKQKLVDYIEKMIPSKIQALIDLLDLKTITDVDLNKYFSLSETVRPKKGLLMIPEIAERIKGYMYLTPKNVFNPKKFAVIYNAIILSKLALLDYSAFSNLAIAAGSKDYSQYYVNNLVVNAFESLDGNHQ